MQFLRTLIWVLVAGIVVAFSINNWAPVPLRLWGGLIADINLPLLMAVMFLLGFVPTYLLYVSARWRLKSRLAGAERTLADMRAMQSAEPEPAVVLTPEPVAASAPPLIPTETPETRS